MGDVLYSPYETYIKTLYELYREEIEDDIEIISNGQGKTLFIFNKIHLLLLKNTVQ